MDNNNKDENIYSYYTDVFNGIVSQLLSERPAFVPNPNNTPPLPKNLLLPLNTEIPSSTFDPKPQDKKQFLCKICKKRFSTRLNLKKHRRINHKPPSISQLLPSYLAATGQRLASTAAAEKAAQSASDANASGSSAGTSSSKESTTASSSNPTSSSGSSADSDDSQVFLCKKHDKRIHRDPSSLVEPGEQCFLCNIFGVRGRRTSYTCADCNETFTTRRALRTHQITHSDDAHFRCNLCEKRFLKQGELKKHHFAVHTKQ